MSVSDSEHERLLQFLYLSPVGIVHMRRDGLVELINPVASALLLPLSMDGCIGNLLTLLDPFVPALRSAIEQFEPDSGAVVEQLRVALPPAGGNSLVAAITVVAIDRERLAVVVNDISRIVAQERQLHLQNQRLRVVVDSLVDYAFFTLDGEGCIEESNSSLERLAGLSEARLVGQSLGSLFDPAEHPPDLPDLLDEATRAGRTNFERWFRHPSRGRFWGDANLSLLVDPHGVATGFGVVVHDISARKKYERELLYLATTDALTGVANRRVCFESGERECARSMRYKRSLSVAMLDIDHFKAINDTYGHDIGDLVLKGVATVCKDSLREMDLVGRIGGEEFVLLAPETSLPAAWNFAERIRVRIANMQTATPRGALSVTVSIGVSALRVSPDDTWDAVLKRADLALYQAKNSGRNQVVLDAS